MYGDNFEENRCMRSIRNGSADLCNFEIRSIHDPIVVQTRSGVLIGGSKEDYKIYKRNNNVDIVSGIVTRRESAVMVNSTQGDWILISNNLYSTDISGFEYNFTEYAPGVSFPLDSIDVNRSTEEWQEVSKVKYQPLRFDNIQANDGIYILIIIAIMVLYIINLYMMYKKYKTSCKSRKGYKYPDINNITELH